jgi:hypothetical protein
MSLIFSTSVSLNGSESGYGKRAALSVFSSPLSDLAVAGSTPERTKGNIYESTDSI